jgi:hypothetical protein
MADPRAAIGRERRRQIQIRRAFEAGLEPGSASGIDLTDFYLMCAAYVVFSLDRLHFQDQMIHDFLVERIPESDAQAHNRLVALDERQRSSRVLVEELQLATDALQVAGPDGCPAFETAAKHFNETFAGMMEARRNPFESYTNELFSDDDWVQIAGSSDEADTAEGNLYNAVVRTAPAGINPETIEVVYH